MTQAGKTHRHLTQTERDRIGALHASGHSSREIGIIIDFNHTAVSREIKRNSYGYDERTPLDKRGSYDPSTAQHKAYVRRHDASYQGKKIHADYRIEGFIITNVKLDWTPDEMAGYMKRNKVRLGFYASKTAIYEWFDSVHGQAFQHYLPKHRNRPKKRKENKTKRVMIPDRTSVHSRPVAVADRQEAGHWEFDSVVSSKRSGSTAALAVAQERTSRLLRVKRVSSLKPGAYATTITQLVGKHHVLSLTTDNGIENKSHKLITAALPGDPVVYFTDPYSSYQKGGVENGNRMLRRYFPKGTDFAKVTQTEVVAAASRINNKPRKILGYKSSLQVAKEKGILTVGGAFRG